MQKKLEAELKSLAHSILKLNDKHDIQILMNKAHDVYQKLSVLSYIETYVKETPQNKKTAEELVAENFENIKDTSEVVSLPEENRNLEESLVTDDNSEFIEEVIPIKKEEEESIEEELVYVEEVENEPLEESIEEKEEINLKEPEIDLKPTLEDEFAGTISLEETTNLFENAKRVVTPRSINDMIMHQKKLQIDLNDRIAFVKNLFESSQEDFNRVISQLNSMETEKEALEFIKLIKRDYDWSDKEVYEERLLNLIERKYS